jgi:hypothetical protein
MWPRRAVWHTRLAGMALLAGAANLQAAPTTFGSVVGSALLCREHLDSAYYYAYMSASFGPAYKREGGAYWFKANASLWGIAISDVLVSDDSSPILFVGAVANTVPDKLDQAIVAATGVHYVKADNTAFALRRSNAGSKIVYFKSKSKIYCDSYNALPRGGR